MPITPKTGSLFHADSHLEIAATRPSIYLDLEDEDERVKLSNPARYFADHEKELVILDEVHRVPELFRRLRGVIDKGRQRGNENGRFLLLGSAAMDLLRQSGESLAGRIAYLELGPFDALEVARGAETPGNWRFPSGVGNAPVRAFPEKAESGDSHRVADMIQASCWEEASMDGEATFGGFA
jgi:predicted AAA+ superfamily ATPase